MGGPLPCAVGPLGSAAVSTCVYVMDPERRHESLHSSLIEHDRPQCELKHFPLFNAHGHCEQLCKRSWVENLRLMPRAGLNDRAWADLVFPATQFVPAAVAF